MKLVSWKEVVEIAGISAIVGSLIFVGLQLKQSQEIAIASQYHERAALAVENFNGQLESGDMRFWGLVSGLEITPDRSAEDAGRFYLTGIAYLTMADNHYYQYQSGFMDEESWQSQRQLLKNVVGRSASPAGFILQNKLHSFRSSFVELTNMLSEELRSETDKDKSVD